LNRLLEVTKNEIVYGTFDIDAFMRKSQALDDERRQLAESLMARRDDAAV
jgi:hypothetical protein